MQFQSAFSFMLIFVAAAGVCGQRTITSLAQANKITPDELSGEIDFDLIGSALTSPKVNGELRNWFFHDGKSGAEIFSENTERTDVKAGDRIRIRGKFSMLPNAVQAFRIEKTEVLGHSPVPAPIPVSGSEIISGDSDFRQVIVGGVVSSAAIDEIDPRYLSIFLRTETGTVFASCRNASMLPFFTRLIDARVAMTGLAIPITGWRNHLGSILILESTNGVRVLNYPISNPFAAEKITNDHSTHRQRAEGVVVAANADCVHLRTAPGHMIAVHPMKSVMLPKSGDFITAVGFVQRSFRHLELTEALIRSEGRRCSLSETIEIPDIEQLFTSTNGQNKINTRYDRKLLRLSGLVKALNAALRA